MPALVQRFIKLQGVALERDQRVIARGVGEILNDLLDALNKAAVEFAGLATGAIVAHIEATRASNRPSQEDMATHVISVPGPLGKVDVAPFEELDKIRNPRGWGPYWRAQEYGTGGAEGVPSQVGRVLFGTFYESETPPDAAQQGTGQGHDVAFIPMGSAPGLGTISVELPPRHFLTDGATEVGRRYLQAMDVIQAQALGALRDLMSGLRRGGGRRFVGRIEA